MGDFPLRGPDRYAWSEMYEADLFAIKRRETGGPFSKFFINTVIPQFHRIFGHRIKVCLLVLDSHFSQTNLLLTVFNFQPYSHQKFHIFPNLPSPPQTTNSYQPTLAHNPSETSPARPRIPFPHARPHNSLLRHPPTHHPLPLHPRPRLPPPRLQHHNPVCRA